MVRAEISDDVHEQVKELTDGEFHVKDSKISFEDRVRVLIEKCQPTE